MKTASARRGVDVLPFVVVLALAMSGYVSAYGHGEASPPVLLLRPALS